MSKTPDFDEVAAHKYFAAKCFNEAWDLIEKVDRTAADDQRMVALNQASIYHWMNRPDCSNQNLSIGYWQASRIQSLLLNAAEAKRWGEVCLSFTEGLPPFYIGYACEALARAAALAQDRPEREKWLSLAEKYLAEIESQDERDALANDLANLK